MEENPGDNPPSPTSEQPTIFSESPMMYKPSPPLLAANHRPSNGGPANAEECEEHPTGPYHGRYFDSSNFRCCMGLFHAKICAFVLCTWFFHEIVLGAIYLFSRIGANEAESRRGGRVGLDPSEGGGGGESGEMLGLLLTCRFIQLLTVALLYVALWRHRPYFLLPFAATQCSIGAFTDIYTLMMLLRQWKRAGGWVVWPLNEEGKWKFLHWLIPLLLYVGVLVALMWVLYKCYTFLRARQEHEEKRMVEKSQNQLLRQQLTLLSHSASSSHSSLTDHHGGDPIAYDDGIDTNTPRVSGRKYPRVKKMSNHSASVSISRHSSNYSARSSGIYAPATAVTTVTVESSSMARTPLHSQSGGGDPVAPAATAAGEEGSGSSSSSVESASSLLERMQQMQLLQQQQQQQIALQHATGQGWAPQGGTRKDGTEEEDGGHG